MSQASTHSRVSAHVATAFQGATGVVSKQIYGILIPGNHPCGPKLKVMFKIPCMGTYLGCYGMEIKAAGTPYSIKSQAMVRLSNFSYRQRLSTAYLFYKVLNLLQYWSWFLKLTEPPPQRESYVI